MITMYGIANCDTVKKARKALETSGVDYHFHDYKKAGAEGKTLRAFVKAFGWEKVVNRSGMTWRKLTDAEKAKVKDEKSALALMQAKPSVIKRPILELDGGMLLLGYDEAAYRDVAQKAA